MFLFFGVLISFELCAASGYTLTFQEVAGRPTDIRLPNEQGCWMPLVRHLFDNTEGATQIRSFDQANKTAVCVRQNSNVGYYELLFYNGAGQFLVGTPLNEGAYGVGVNKNLILVVNNLWEFYGIQVPAVTNSNGASEYYGKNLEPISFLAVDFLKLKTKLISAQKGVPRYCYPGDEGRFYFTYEQLTAENLDQNNPEMYLVTVEKRDLTATKSLLNVNETVSTDNSNKKRGCFRLAMGLFVCSFFVLSCWLILSYKNVVSVS